MEYRNLRRSICKRPSELLDVEAFRLDEQLCGRLESIGIRQCEEQLLTGPVQSMRVTCQTSEPLRSL